MKQGKKVLLVILAIVTMLIGIFALTGCNDDVKETNAGNKYVIFENNVGLEYRVEVGAQKTVYYDWGDRGFYNFKYTVYYSSDDSPTGESGNSNLCVGKYNDPEMLKIDGFAVGAHEIRVYSKKESGLYVVTKLIVVINEKLVSAPDISFETDGVIDFTENEEYVYHYDGAKHYPNIILTYNNNNIELNSDGVRTVETLDAEDDATALVDVGVYRVVYALCSDNYELDAAKRYCSDVYIEITVKIVDEE